MSGGWFALNRGMFEHPLFKGRPDRVAAWVWIIAHAAWKDTRQNVSGTIVEVKRGQLCASQAMMQEGTGMSRKALRNFLAELERERAVVTEGSTKGAKSRTLLTIVNYDKYQSADGARGQTRAKQGPNKGQEKEQGNKGTTSSIEEVALSAPIEVNIVSKAVWDAGKAYLASREVKEPGKMIGRWLKTHSPHELLKAIEAAQRVGTHDPVGYIGGVLRSDAGTGDLSADEIRKIAMEGIR